MKSCFYFSLFLISISLLISPGILPAKDTPKAEKAAVVREPEEKKAQSSLQELKQFVSSNLSSEQQNVENLKNDLENIKKKRDSLQTELNAYRIQLSTYGNLLVMPGVSIQDLEKAYASGQSSVKSMEAILSELTPKREHYMRLLRQTLDQQALNEKQLSQIKAETGPDESNEELISKLDEIIRLLSSKEELLNDLIEEYTKEIDALSNVKTALEELVVKFDTEIENRKKEALFKRKDLPLISSQWLEISKELVTLEHRLLEMTTKDFWLDELSPILEDGFYIRLFAFLVFTSIIISILYRLRRYCLFLRELPVCGNFPWRLLTLRVFQRSLLLFGITLFFTIYVQLRHLDTISLFHLGLNILWIWVFTKWGIDFTVVFNKTMNHQIPSPLLVRMRLVMLLVRFSAILYLAVDWLLSGTGVVLFALRFLFELILIVWSVTFVHHLKDSLVKHSLEDASLSSRPGFKILKSIMPGVIYIVVGGAPLLELAGYGTLAFHWFVSWGRTGVVLLWAGLVFFLLKEWHQRINVQPPEDYPAPHRNRSRTFQWLMFKICWLVWLAALCMGILFSWGARQAVIINIIDAVKYPLPLGAVTLSLLGFLNAFLVLFFTQIAARLWRHFLTKKILPQSGIEIGLQESIITITTYILWSLGILMALYAFGLNMTSITVAFGALGIGLGFGLQNIFNNFISGIILLFERPIQVGDDVEVNGLWATVRKINVRSTIVQTFDNASLIIPNSDFISSQVTNWSFKDKTIRRQISVGVAYGSDIELVRDSLLEVAKQTPNVFTYPKPDVLFVDFADSALVFKLRLWTDVDHMLKVDTAIRFAIDRLFRERNITIAFPQCDVHLFQENVQADSRQPCSTPDSISEGGVNEN